MSGLKLALLIAVPLTLVGWAMTLVLRRGIRWRWAGRAVIIGSGAGLYWTTRDLRPARLVAGQAHANALQVLDIERALGLGGFESTVNGWLAHQHALGTFCADFYGSAHLFVSALLLCWIGASGHRSWRWALPALAGLFTCSMAVFILHPVAPPWTLAGFHGLSGGIESGSAPAALEFAAFPSLHVGFAVWAAMVGREVWPRLGRAVWCYPAFVAFVVVGTANHYLLDAVGGAALALVFVALAKAACRRIPVGAFHPHLHGVLSRPTPTPVGPVPEVGLLMAAPVSAVVEEVRA